MVLELISARKLENSTSSNDLLRTCSILRSVRYRHHQDTRETQHPDLPPQQRYSLTDPLTVNNHYDFRLAGSLHLVQETQFMWPFSTRLNLYFTLKMEAPCNSETLVSYRNTTGCHNLQEATFNDEGTERKSTRSEVYYQ
jgi:hypothetical protein